MPLNKRFSQSTIGDRFRSTWTLREKIARQLWMVTEATIFRFSPRVCYSWRTWLLRCFGCKIHPSARLRPTVTIELPWNLCIGENTLVGDHAILYCLGPVKLGDRVTISQYSHLCAGTHDYTLIEFPLIRMPITIQDDVWIAADTFVGPGVCIGARSVIGARSSVFSDLPSDKVCFGTPAKPVKDRHFNTAVPALNSLDR